MASIPARRSPPQTADCPRRAAGLPDRRARNALGQERRHPEVLSERDGGPLRRPPGRPRGGAGRDSVPPAMTAAQPEDEPDALAATLAELLDDLAADFEDVERREGSNGIDYTVRTKAFAHLIGDAASFRLRPQIVLAAARTPGATVSPLGPEWV